MRFTDRVVLITGGGRGIGAATARAFADEGAITIINYSKSADAATALAAEMAEAGGRAEAVCADVRDGSAVKAMVTDIVKRHKRIDVLVNNAGITRDQLTAVMTDDEWDDVLAVNVGGAFRVARAVCRPMMRQRAGRIINVSSVAGQKGGRGQANYAASKAALEGMTRALAVELAARNIAVNAVAPGVIDTDMSEFIREAAHEQVLDRILLKRIGRVDEVAQVILFLASDAASYITGAVIPVDGGFKMA